MKLEKFIQEISEHGVKGEEIRDLLDRPEETSGDPDIESNGDITVQETGKSGNSLQREIGKSKGESLFGKIGTTRFRSLQYDKGEKPLVVSKLPEINSNRTDPEAFSRVIRPVTARKDDLVRITKLLVKPGGIRWEAHQAELQMMQNQLESKREVQNINSNLLGLLKNVGSSLLSTAVKLTPSTLIQVGVAGTGEHQTPYSNRAYLKKGTSNNTSGILGFLTTVGNYIGIIPSATLVDGANLAKSGKPIPINGTESRLAIEGEARDNRDTLYGKNLLLSTEVRPGNQIKSGEDLGGKAEANIAEQTYEEKWVKTQFNREHSPLTRKTSEWAKKTSRVDPRNESEYRYSVEPDMDTGSVAKVIFGQDTSPGHPSKKDTPAKQNYLNPVAFTGESAKSLFADFYESDPESGIDGINNLIPFRIVAITPEWMYPLSFEANLESYNDNYNADWSEVRYIGRGEKYWTYTGFDRDISFSFNALAHNKRQLESLYRNLNMLAGTTAPTYDESGVFMRGTFVSVTIGELLYDQLGFFKSISFKWDKDVMWEIDGTPGPGYGGQDPAESSYNFLENAIRVPHMLTVDVTFKPIHSFVPTLDNPYRNNYYFGIRHSSTGSNGSGTGLKKNTSKLTGNVSMQPQGTSSETSSGTGNAPVYKDSNGVYKGN